VEYRLALGLLRPLVADFPDVVAYRLGLARAYSRLGEALERRGSLDEAITAHRQAVDLRPVPPGYYAHLFGLLARTGRLDEAVAEYEAQLRRDPDDALAHYLLARVHYQECRWEEAADHFSRVLTLKETFPEVLNYRGAAFLTLGRWDEAVADFSRAIELGPDRWEMRYGLGMAYFRQEQWDRAVADFSRAIELAPEVHTNWAHRGHSYLHLARWEEAAADFGQLVERWPQDQNGWYFRGVAHCQLGKPDLAMSDLRQAVAKGFKDVARFKGDPGLDPLRSHDDFKKLLASFQAGKE
jgi:tetratricopeptide (TPR) repeat protein